MSKIKAPFQNQQGEILVGLLKTPDVPAQAYVIFVHCFSCSKDIAAASRITLAQKNIALLRFDIQA